MTREAFEWPKVALLLLGALAIGALALSDVGRARPSIAGVLGAVREPVGAAVLLVLMAGLVSTLASISPRVSLSGGDESLGGLVTVAAYAVLFFATRQLCAHAAIARRLLVAATVGAAVAATYALLQLVGADPIRWARVSPVCGFVRPFGTLGHPNHLAGFLAMAFPLVAYFAHRAEAGARPLVALGYRLVGVVAVVALVFTFSRGGWLALAVALGVLVAGWLAIGARRAALAAGGLLAALGLGLGVAYLSVSADTGILACLAGRGEAIAQPGARREIWRIAFDLFRDRPIFGWGLDAFGLAFERRRTVAYWLAEWGGTPTRAHNELLQALATQGVIGGAALVGLTVALAIAIVRAWRRTGEERALLVAVVAAIAAFYVQSVFSFTVAACGALFVTLAAVVSRLGADNAADRIASSDDAPAWRVAGLAMPVAVFAVVLGVELARTAASGGRGLLGIGALVAVLGGMTVAAMAMGREAGGPPRRSAPPHPRAGFRMLPVVLAAVALATAYVVVVRPLGADRAAAEALRVVERDPAAAIRLLEEAVALAPGRDAYHVQLGLAREREARLARSTAARVRGLRAARDAMATAARLVDAEGYHHARLGRILARLAVEGDVAPAEAYAAFDRALALDPVNAYLYLEAGQAALLLADLERARGHASRAAELYPDFGAPWAMLAEVATRQGRLAEAAELFGKALASDWHGDEAGRVAARARLAGLRGQSGS